MALFLCPTLIFAIIRKNNGHPQKDLCEVNNLTRTDYAAQFVPTLQRGSLQRKGCGERCGKCLKNGVSHTYGSGLSHTYGGGLIHTTFGASRTRNKKGAVPVDVGTAPSVVCEQGLLFKFGVKIGSLGFPSPWCRYRWSCLAHPRHRR